MKLSRRSLLLAPAAGSAAQAPRPVVRSGYLDWSWERWREITRESRPTIVSDQSGKAFLCDLLVDAAGKKIESAEEWARRRAQLRSVLDVFLGPAPRKQAALDAKVIQEEDAGDHRRRHVTFQTEPGEIVPGLLLIPKQARGKLPALLVPHQTTQDARKEPAGLAGNPRMHIALELVRRGYVTFTYDALCFGERHDPGSGHYGDAIPFYRKHPEWSVLGKMVWDLSRAVDYLQTLDVVDPSRIGSIGHSHGGYTTLIGMALDERIRVGVSSCGFETFRHDGNVWRWSHATALLPRLGYYISSPYISMRNYVGVPDSETPQVPFDMHWMLALIAPRAVFLSTSDEDAIFPNGGWSARMALARLEPVYRLLGAEGKMGSYFFRGGHGFPVDAAERANGWLDRWMKS